MYIILGFVISCSAVLSPHEKSDEVTNTNNKAVGVLGFFKIIIFGPDYKNNPFKL
jgi:hypothetical protein